MKPYTRPKKTILLAFPNVSDIDYLTRLLSSHEYRIIRANSFLTLIEALDRFKVHLLIADVKLADISMAAFLPFLRKRFSDIKVIIAMKNYSPELELTLRQYNILYVMRWPINGELFMSVVEKGLKRFERGLVSI